MNCKQFRADLSDWATGRLDALRQERMAAHCAACPACARCEREERTLTAAFQQFPNPPTPNLVPRLSARIHTVVPSARPRRPLQWAMTGLACSLAILIGLHLKGAGRQEPTYPPLQNLTTLPQQDPPLEKMLAEVRWRSSEEREMRQEPPAYNAGTRALLLSEEGK